MIFFLPKSVWENKRGFRFGKPTTYLSIGYHPGQDFFTRPVGKIPVIAPRDGLLKTLPFSKTAGWWAYYKFDHEGKTYSLKILHMYKPMKDGKYKKGNILGYCGATGFSITNKYGKFYSGPSHEDQISDKAVPHLHVELHKGEFKHDTNKNKTLADKRIIDPVSNFEKWVNKVQPTNDKVIKPEIEEKKQINKTPNEIVQPNKRKNDSSLIKKILYQIINILRKK